MKKRLLALILVLVMVLSFGLVAVGCQSEPTDTTGIETELKDVKAALEDLKAQLAANKLNLANLEAALAALKTAAESSSDSLEALEALAELEAIVAQLQGQASETAKQVAIDLYESLVREFRDNTTAADTAVAYGTVHGGYIGEAIVEIDDEGNVVDVELNEYFLPHSYATNNTSPDLNKSWQNQATLQGNYAKYIQVGDAIFETTGATAANIFMQNGALYGVDGTGSNTYKAGDPKTTASSIVYKQIASTTPGQIGVAGVSAANISDLTGFITRNQKAAQWYIEQVNSGNFKILKTRSDATGAVATVGTAASPIYLEVAKTETYADAAYNNTTPAPATKQYTEITAANNGAASGSSYGINKAEGHYWSLYGNYPLGWLGNFGPDSELVDVMVATNLSFHAYRFVRNNTYWTAGIVNSGATANDLQEYWMVAQQAYLNALMGKQVGASAHNTTHAALTNQMITNAYTAEGTTAAAVGSSIAVRKALQVLYTANDAAAIPAFRAVVKEAAKYAGADTNTVIDNKYIVVEATGDIWALSRVTDEKYEATVKVVYNMTDDKVVDILYTAPAAEYTAASYQTAAFQYALNNTFTEAFFPLIGKTATEIKAITKLASNSTGVLYTGGATVATGATETGRNVVSAIVETAKAYTGTTATNGIKFIAKSIWEAEGIAKTSVGVATALKAYNDAETAEKAAKLTALNDLVADQKAGYTDAKYEKRNGTSIAYTETDNKSWGDDSHINNAAGQITVTVVFLKATGKIIDIIYTPQTGDASGSSYPTTWENTWTNSAIQFVGKAATEVKAFTAGTGSGNVTNGITVTTGATNSHRNLACAIVEAAKLWTGA